jgi:AraC-like DNA-binding protein
MTYFKIILSDLPRVAFAHTQETDKYDMRSNPHANILELTSLEQGDVTVTYEDGKKIFLPAPGFIANIHRITSRATSYSPRIRHTTAVIFATYTYEEISIEEVCSLRHHTLLPSQGQTFMAILPLYLPYAPEYEILNQHLAHIIRAEASLSPAKNLRCASAVFSLLAELTAISIQTAVFSLKKDLPSGADIYCRKAMQYVQAHMHEKISVAAIAEELDLSPGYLSKIFRETVGQTLVSYISQVKMEKVKNLVFTHNNSLKDAGAQVGITDQNYLSRLFKQYTGLTVQEYRSIRANMTDK